ncbi:MAG TPA: twin-arginine translocase TatA/TatE family subunit [Steroidobacteraceae bacterium]|nr:twin-arginine translocase TatA/TatE family subunit [Steroidobacteraceae bacterium]
MVDVVLILIIVLLIFGSKKLRTLGTDLGSAIKGFRRGLADGSSGKRSEQVESTPPDAEFPEVADAERVRRKGD